MDSKFPVVEFLLIRHQTCFGKTDNLRSKYLRDSLTSMTAYDIQPLPFLKVMQPPFTVFHQAAAPLADLRVCVVVPARNEAENLPYTLSALYRQTTNQGLPLCKKTYEVLVLINNCTDNSLEIARQFQQQHPDFAMHISYVGLPKSKANIGTVRRMLMDEACRRLKQTSSNGIIASTDGDTVVDEKWIYNILQEIGKGADAVGGRILTQSNNNPVRRWHLRDVMYRTLLAQAEVIIDPCTHDPWPRHYQYFGANLAVTCAAYERAGRLPEVPFLEDHAFFEALKTVDARIRRSNAVRAYTSDRQHGRVEVGFSEQLKTWSQLITKEKTQVTEPVAPQMLKWKCKKALRQVHSQFHHLGEIKTAELASICRPLQIPYNWMLIQIKTCNYFGELWQLVEKRLILNKWNEQWLPQHITEAISELRLFVSQRR